MGVFSLGYYDFGRGIFEDRLSSMLDSNGLGRWYDVSDRLREGKVDLIERVYLVSTRDRRRSILVYSTLDIRTDRVSDEIGRFVRFYLVEKRLDGYEYKYLGRRLRTEVLFDRMESFLIDVNKRILDENFVSN